MYGFGVVLLEIMVGKRAMDKNRPSSEKNLVDWARPLLIRATKLLMIIDPKMQGQYSSRTASKVGNLAHRCLSENPKVRPSMKEVVESLETYNQEEMLYQSKKAAGTLQEDFEEAVDRPSGQQQPSKTQSGRVENIVHDRRRESGNGRSRSDPPPKEFDQRLCPPLDCDGPNTRSTPTPDNYER